MSGTLYNCDKCVKSFSSIKGLKLHMYCHIRENNELKMKAESTAKAKVRMYACFDCPQKFMALKEYKLHIKTHNIESKAVVKSSSKENIRMYFCSICSERFEKLKKYKLHYENHSKESKPEAEPSAKKNIEKYTCPICSQKFAKVKEFRLHSKTHNTESMPKAEPTAKKKVEKYKCSACSQTFVKLKEFRLHSKSHNTESVPKAEPTAKKKVEKYMCSICAQRFVKLKEFKLHSKTHHTGSESESSRAKSPVIITAPQSYKCPNCPKSFGRYRRFQHHLCSHIKFSDYSCKQCLKSFRSESLLNSHNKNDHSGKLYCCSICNKRFYKHLAFQHHRTKHMFQAPYKCPECGASFSSINKRLRHIKNHVSKCAICKAPINKGEYFRHVSETHGNVGDITIPDSTSSEEDMSENEENTREDLNVVLTSDNWNSKSNSETENTVCSPSQKSFSNCFICDKTVSKKYLNDHVKSHNVYKCSTCTKYFSSELKLKAHHEKEHVKEASNSLQICNPIQSNDVYVNNSVVPADWLTNNSLINSSPVKNQIVSSKELRTTQKNLGSLIINSVPSVFQSNSEGFKIDSVFSAKDLPLPQALQLNSESEVSNDIIDWSTDLEEKCKKLGYPISKELCEIIEKTIDKLNYQIKNSKDLPPEKKGIYRQIVGRLKNILIENIEHKCKGQ